MSVTGTFLVVITASFLKPLLSTNQSLQLSTVDAYNPYSNVLPFEEADMDSDGAPNLFLTLRLPQLLTDTKDLDLDMKRQFDPWGGKRHSKSLEKDDDNIGRKRQFSPWGGKRSSSKSSQFIGNDLAGADAKLIDILSLGNKRGFNSWGGKRGSCCGKRNSNPGDERRFNSWGGKRNFNAWGGKRFANDLNTNFDELSFAPKKNTNIGSKRQAFNSWGGKRSFNSWGGKRAFNSWGGKRDKDFEQEPKEQNASDEVSIPQAFNGITNEIESNMR